MYALNENFEIVDAYGRVLLGMDGAPVQITAVEMPVTKMEMAVEMPETDMEMVVAPSTECTEKVSAKKSRKTNGCKRPANLSVARDYALATVKQGVEPNTWWYVGEMAGNGSGDRMVLKRWKKVSAVTESLAKAEAWTLIQQYREEKFTVEQRVGLLTPEQDSDKLAKMTSTPSKAAKKRNVDKCRANRKARGLTVNGTVRKN